MKIKALGSKDKFLGKAGNLNKLFYDFNIANGFILSNEWLDEFLSLNNIDVFKSNNIDDEIMNGDFFHSDELMEYFTSNGFEKVIVRSSVQVEDGDKYSFAGQFDSFTNVNVDNLIFYIKKCWSSMFKDNVSSYLKLNKNLNYDVLIQEMVISDIAGIAFSVNPSNGKRGIVVEACDGQCEDLVSGKRSPNIYNLNVNKCGDELLKSSDLSTIEENINKLVSIFKKDIEIEFAFKKGVFYLFQVRPITKVYFSLNDYLESECWCCFKNNMRSLFTRTLWILGATKYKHKSINNEVTEDVTLYYPHNERQLRGFNGMEPPLDEITINRHSSEDVNKYIDEYKRIVDKIRKLSLIIKNDINSNNYRKFNNNLKKLIELNAIINSYEYLIGSLGQAMYDVLDDATIKRISDWRNSEDSYFPIYEDIFNYVYVYFSIEVDKYLFRNYVSVQELLSLCDKKIKVSTIISRIKKREKRGFVLLNLQNPKYNNAVICRSDTIEVVRYKFENRTREKKNDADVIGGHATFKIKKKIRGECLVLNSHDDISKMDAENKILICEVTTAKDVKYLKKVRALIVNSGGILCHSAIFSREYKIPCLIGCEVATDYFNSGDIVELDLDKEIARKINN